MKNKGITLIALVITIIILLILSGIIINLTIGQKGILTRAKEAGKNYQEATAREDEELIKLWEEAENILKGTVGKEEPGVTKPTLPEGEGPKDPTTSETAVEELKAGDYVKYDTGVSSVGENGIIVCRVLYPMDSEYGLQIISNKNIKEGVALGGNNWEEGKIAYNKAIEILNSEAEKYINTAYAYDGRCVGSIPTVRNGMFIDKNKETETTIMLPLKDWTSYTRPTGWTSDNTECYDSDTNYMIDETVAKELNIWKTGQSYWLASRRANKVYPSIYFGIRDVETSGNIHFYSICRLDYTGNISGHFFVEGLRVCISLKYDSIKIISGDGKSETSAYIIGR